MTIYNQYTVQSVFVPAEKTVSGHEAHEHHIKRKQGDDSRAPVALTCVECEPHLLREGWSKSPGLVALTDDQIEEQEEEDRRNKTALRHAGEALASAARDARPVGR